tara:strand:- start:2139 stop:2861 length:723 start_codon:yes stop_codon:yes gene_type:complete
MIPSIRLLPALIIVCFIVMGLRVVNVVTGESISHDPFDFNAEVTLSQARAAEGEDLADESGDGDEAAMDESGQLAAMEAGDEAVAEGDDEDLWFDPENRELTRAELRLLQELSERRQDLGRREQQLDQREALLEAAESRFEQKFAELAGLRDQLQVLLKQHDSQQEAQLNSLVKIYESMKPKDAARIFDTLDMDVLLDVVMRMKEARSAAVLAEMTPDRAKEVTLQLADQRNLPEPVVLE